MSVRSEYPWSVPVAVADIPETGKHVVLSADDQVLRSLAKVAGVLAVRSLEAEFDLVRRGADGVRVTGRISASVDQQCVLTLAPLQNTVDETIDLEFAPASSNDESVASGAPVDEPPEVLHNGIVDLGAVAIEFLLLGIDPYPRKPGAVFDAPKHTENPANHPFAALATLKKGSPDAKN